MYSTTPPTPFVFAQQPAFPFFHFFSWPFFCHPHTPLHKLESTPTCCCTVAIFAVCPLNHAMPCLFSNNGVAQLNAVMSVKVAQPAGPELTGSDIRSTVLPVFEVTVSNKKFLLIYFNNIIFYIQSCCLRRSVRALARSNAATKFIIHTL